MRSASELLFNNLVKASFPVWSLTGTIAKSSMIFTIGAQLGWSEAMINFILTNKTSRINPDNNFGIPANKLAHIGHILYYSAEFYNFYYSYKPIKILPSN